jgi:hypothetical protein
MKMVRNQFIFLFFAHFLLTTDEFFVSFFTTAELGDWSKKFGYLDSKAYYYSKTAADGEIHLKVPIGDDGRVWICGFNKEALVHAKFFVEKLEDVEKFNPALFVPDTSKREEWTKKKYTGAECKELFGLSYGEYVVSVASTGEKGIHISYVITWPKKSKWISSN